jgi:hypothetical protein
MSSVKVEPAGLTSVSLEHDVEIVPPHPVKQSERSNAPASGRTRMEKAPNNSG